MEHNIKPFNHNFRASFFIVLFLMLIFAVQMSLKTVTAVSPSQPQGNSGTISGTIYESDGITPILAGVFIDLYDTSSSEWIAGAQVTSNGTYTITNITAGSYLVRAIGPAYTLEFHDDAGVNGLDATSIQVVDNSHSGVDFTLDLGGTISGVVYAEDGITPLENINVAPVDVWIGACTNSDGEFMLENVPLNTPLIIYSGSGNWCAGEANNYIREWWPEADNPSLATAVTLTPETAVISGIQFTLSQGGHISGVVYANDGSTPLANLNIGIDNLPIGACTNANGEYTLYGVPLNNPVTLYAGSENWCLGGESNFIREWWDEAATPSEATPISLAVESAEINNIDFSLALGGSISGVVYETNAVTPLANLNVGVDGLPIGTCTDENGEYTLSGLPVDTPLVIYAGSGNWCANGSDNYRREWWNEADRVENAASITLTVASLDVIGTIFTLEQQHTLYLPLISSQ